MVGPHVDALATEYEGKAVVGKVNVDLHGGIAAQFELGISQPLFS